MPDDSEKKYDVGDLSATLFMGFLMGFFGAFLIVDAIFRVLR